MSVVMAKGNNGNEEDEEEARRINELNVPWSKQLYASTAQ